jgi:RNA polymerase sigma-70 factor, ECF subfamily
MVATTQALRWPWTGSGSSLAAMPGTVAGDGAAFAELYDQYESRVFNLCYRITGSRDDAADATQEAFLGLLPRLPELSERGAELGSYVLTSARNACYDLIARRKRAEPSDELPESATPVGSGPSDPSEDPDRNVLLAAQQEEIRQANESLPERQREVLALRELEELSYDEIADVMGMNRNSVAQLISRARINLRDALRGTALHSIAASSSACERGLPLLAMRQDGQLPDGEDAAWLSQHLASCETCRLSNEAMQEAGTSYRAWLPIGASPLLFKETMARAAELSGGDWTDVIESRRPSAAAGAAGPVGWWRLWRAHRRRDLVIVGLLVAVLLVVVFEAELHDEPAPPARAVPVAEETKVPAAGPQKPDRERSREQPPEDSEPVAPAEEAVAVDGGQVAGSQEAQPQRRKRTEAKAEQESTPPVEEELPPTTVEEPPPPTTEPPPPTPPVEDPPPPPPTTDPPVKPPPRVCRDPNGQPIRCPTP